MNLPDEVMLHIMSFLDAADLCEVSLACNHWNLLSNEAVLWRSLCTKYSFLPQNYEGQKWNQETTGYKQLFLSPCCFNLRRLNSALTTIFLRLLEGDVQIKCKKPLGWCCETDHNSKAQNI